MALTQITLTGTFLSPKDNAPVSGKVIFTLSHPIQDTVGDQIISQKAEEVVLDANGSFSIDLIANDSEDATPQGTTYLVDEQFEDSVPRQYQISIPADAEGGTIDLADLTPTTDIDLTFQYALLVHSHEHTHDGYVAGSTTLTVSDTEPDSPSENDLWVDTS